MSGPVRGAWDRRWNGWWGEDPPFHAPVFVGDLVSFYAETLRLGTTSVSVKVTVEAERRTRGAGRVKVTEAEVVYVHVSEENRPMPIPAAGATP